MPPKSRTRSISNALRALIISLTSALLGAAYFWYLNTEPFPPDLIRLIPIAWLAGSILGGILSARALTTGSNRIAAALALLLTLPSVGFALVFTMAALMGD